MSAQMQSDKLPSWNPINNQALDEEGWHNPESGRSLSERHRSKTLNQNHSLSLPLRTSPTGGEHHFIFVY